MHIKIGLQSQVLVIHRILTRILYKNSHIGKIWKKLIL